MSMHTCRHCNKELTSKRNIYCNNTCQQAYQNDQKIAEWLRTGKVTLHGSTDHFVKKYISEQQKHKCSLCGTGKTWFGKPLNFILDHIDGNPNNNHRNNLRLICHNCDSQLDTYKSRNLGNGRHARRERYKDGKSY